MAIKNKDGTPYLLRKPNPIMKEQDHWDKSQLILHNMKWNGVTIPDESIVQSFKSDFRNHEPVKQESQIEEEPYDPYINGPELEIKTATVRPAPGQEAPRPQITSDIPVAVFWCRPAVIRERIDPVYGDKQKTIQYGQKFTFEGVIVEQNYMDFKFWTTLGHLTEGSVVFPQTDDRRWWEIRNIEEKTGGWLVSCIISNSQPDFLTG